MPTTGLAHAALSAAAVGILLSILRKAGPRAGGLAAAVPINSIPALVWLSLEHGGSFAGTAVLASLCGTGLTVLLGASFARLTLTLHVVLSALLAWLAIGALVALALTLPAVLAVAAILAVCAIPLGHALLPELPASEVHRPAARRMGILPPMATAGAMSLLVSELGRHSGPQFCGLVATIPVIGMFALYAGYRQGGVPLMLRVLSGYLDGMVAKAAFLGTLGLAWAAGPWAWPAALVAAAVALQLQQRLRARDPHVIGAATHADRPRAGPVGHPAFGTLASDRGD